MRISDWSSDVCSSDLWHGGHGHGLRRIHADNGQDTRRLDGEHAWNGRPGRRRYGRHGDGRDGRHEYARRQQSPAGHDGAWGPDAFTYAVKPGERSVGKKWGAKVRTRWRQ